MKTVVFILIKDKIKDFLTSVLMLTNKYYKMEQFNGCRIINVKSTREN